MPRLIRVHDPDEVERRIQILVRGTDFPGLLEFLGSLPHGAESALIRSILYQWLLTQQREGTLDNTVQGFVAGLASKKRTSGRSAGTTAPTRLDHANGEASSVVQRETAGSSVKRPLVDTSETVSDAESRSGTGTNHGIDSPVPGRPGHPEIVDASKVVLGGKDDESDAGMLADIGSFLG